MVSVLEPTETLEDCLICHNFCAQFGPLWFTIVVACRAVSNINYPRLGPRGHVTLQWKSSWPHLE